MWFKLMRVLFQHQRGRGTGEPDQEGRDGSLMAQIKRQEAFLVEEEMLLLCY